VPPRRIIAQLVEFWRNALPGTAPVFRINRALVLDGDWDDDAWTSRRSRRQVRSGQSLIASSLFDISSFAPSVSRRDMRAARNEIPASTLVTPAGWPVKPGRIRPAAFAVQHAKQDANERRLVMRYAARPMSATPSPNLLVVVYVVAGAIIASTHHYYAHLHTAKQIGSAVLAILLWPLLYLGINLHIH
jgi:hypothetical protein